MFDFSFFELLLVSLIALLVVGPDRLPTLVRTIGFWVGRARAVATSVRSEFEREVNAAGVKETERRLRDEVADVDRELRDSAVGEADAGPGRREPSRYDASAEGDEASQAMRSDASADRDGSADCGSSDRQ